MNWGDQIKRYRFQRGLTQESLAEEWGIAVRSIRRYEAGDTIPAAWLETVRAKLKPTDIRQIGALEAYRALVETNSLAVTLYDANLYIVAASQAALDYWRPTQDTERLLIGAHMSEVSTPEVINSLASLGGVNAIMREKSILSGSVRQERKQSTAPTFWTRSRFYIVRNTDGSVMCVLMFTDPLTQAEFKKLPEGIVLH